GGRRICRGDVVEPTFGTRRPLSDSAGADGDRPLVGGGRRLLRGDYLGGVPGDGLDQQGARHRPRDSGEAPIAGAAAFRAARYPQRRAAVEWRGWTQSRPRSDREAGHLLRYAGARATPDLLRDALLHAAGAPPFALRAGPVFPAPRF